MKGLRRFSALMCALALLVAAPAITSAHAIEMEEKPGESSTIMPRALLLEWDLDTGSRGTDETPSFHMEKGDGLYLRWYCDVPSYSEPIHVYLYDINKGAIVSAMSPQVDPGEQRTEVFYVGDDSRLSEFRIMIESVTGGTGYATVRANQIHS